MSPASGPTTPPFCPPTVSNEHQAFHGKASLSVPLSHEQQGTPSSACHTNTVPTRSTGW